MGSWALVSSLVVIATVGRAYAQPIHDPNAPPLPPPDVSSEPPPPEPQPQPPPPPPQPYPQPQPYPPPAPYWAPQPQPPPPKPEKQPDLICFAGRPFECSSVILLELGARGDKTATVTSADTGLLIHDGYNAYGATIGVLGIEGGKQKEGSSIWYAGRYRRYLGRWGIAADVSVGYADGAAFDVAIGWFDVIAITAGINQYEREDSGQEWVATAGFRIGAVAIGGIFYLTIAVFGSAR